MNANDDFLGVSHHLDSMQENVLVFDSILNLRNKVTKQNSKTTVIFHLLI